jgi:anti-sigma factor RsiW
VTHEVLQELLGAYALDAVDRDEAVAVEAHLVECPRCRAEVTELREVAALMGNSGADAPPAVWDRIVSSLDDAPPELRLVVGATKRRRVFNRIVLGAAAAVLVVVAISVVRLRSEVDDLKGGRRGDEIALAAQHAMAEPSARIARLAGLGDATAIAVVRADGQGYFVGSSLRQPPHIYELWGATSSGHVIPLGTMSAPGVFAFMADPSITTVMITEEQRPVNVPTSSPILTGTLV